MKPFCPWNGGLDEWIRPPTAWCAGGRTVGGSRVGRRRTAAATWATRNQVVSCCAHSIAKSRPVCIKRINRMPRLLARAGELHPNLEEVHLRHLARAVHERRRARFRDCRIREGRRLLKHGIPRSGNLLLVEPEDVNHGALHLGPSAFGERSDGRTDRRAIDCADPGDLGRARALALSRPEQGLALPPSDHLAESHAVMVLHPTQLPIEHPHPE